MLKKSDGWGTDNWIHFIASAVADLISDGDGSTSVLSDASTNSITITFNNINKDDPRLPQKFADLLE